MIFIWIFYGSFYSTLGLLFIGDYLVFTGGKVLGSDGGLQLRSTSGKFLGTVLGNVG